MTQVAAGRWEAQVDAPSAPHTPVVVTTGGTYPRTGSGLLSTTDGRAELAGTFGETVRRDAAGRITELTLAPDVTTAQSGTWRVTLSLRSDDGRRVDDATGVAILPAGGGQVPVVLDGASLAEAGIDGPWRVMDVLLTDAADDSFVDLEETLGTTATYRVADLAGDRVQIGTVFTDRLVDPDGDGDPDILEVDGTVDVRTTGTYAINARLVSLDGEPLGEFATFTSLPGGTSPFTLGFSGGAIGRSGIDGPYRVVDLSVYAVADQNDAFDFRIEAHRTQPYVSGEFEGGRVTIEDVLVALQAAEDEGRVPQGIARSLAVKLHGAADARDRGQPDTACNKLDAFSNELQAQSGKHVPVATADELAALAARAKRPLCG